MDTEAIQQTQTPGSNGKTEKVNPFFSCWFQPGKTIRFVFPFWGDRFMHRLFMLRGMLLIASLRMPYWVQTGADPIELAVLLLVIGPIVGLFYGYATGSILKGLTRKLGGVNSGETAFRICVAWSLPWSILGTALCLASCWFLFPSEIPLPKPPIDYFSVYLGFSIVGLTMIASFIQRSVAVSVAGGLSLKKSVIANILAFFIFSIPVGFVIFIYAGILTRIIDF